MASPRLEGNAPRYAARMHLIASNVAAAQGSMKLALAVGLACMMTLAGCGGGADPDTQSSDAETAQLDETHLKFGQTAHFRSSAGSSDVPLEITVAAPKSFKPAKDAIFWDARVEGAYEGKRYSNNVVFTITVKNVSTDEAYRPMIIPDVHVTEAADYDVSNIVQDDLEGGTGEIPPGKAVTIKDAYSLKSMEDLEYQLAIDGLAGRTYYFK